MNSYGQFCPLSKAVEIVAERWTPLVLRELILGSKHFNEIRRGVPLMSSALLSRRLKTLERAGVVIREEVAGTRRPSYVLSPAGRELEPLIMGLAEWGQRWVRTSYAASDLDPSLLMWDIRRFVRPREFGRDRTVVEFEFSRAPAGKARYWLVSTPDDADLCYLDPGFDVDLYVHAELRAMVQVWVGDLELGTAMRTGLISLDGPSELRRQFPMWLGENPLRNVQDARPARGQPAKHQPRSLHGRRREHAGV